MPAMALRDKRPVRGTLAVLSPSLGIRHLRQHARHDEAVRRPDYGHIEAPQAVVDMYHGA